MARTLDLSTEAHELLGTSLDGRYLLEEVLGVGAMGVVFRARQWNLSRPVAVKRMRRSAAADERLVARFRREARTLRTLRHPHLVRYVGDGDDATGRAYLATEYLEGLDVWELLKRSGPFDEALTLYLLRQASEGLEVAHARGIVHRDLKPDNLFLAKEPRGRHSVRILDFGLALRLGRPDEDDLTRLGLTAGTPAYMSPEQFRADWTDPRSDLYSLGCIAYKVLTGHLPFRGETVRDLGIAHCRTTPRAPEKHGVSRRLSDLVMWLLEKQRTDRPRSASMLLEALHDPELVPARAREEAARLEAPAAKDPRTISAVLRSLRTRVDRWRRRGGVVPVAQPVAPLRAHVTSLGIC